MKPETRQCPNCGAHDRLLVAHQCEGSAYSVTHCGCFYDADQGQHACAVRGDCACADVRAAREAAEARAADESHRAHDLARRVQSARGDVLRRHEAAHAWVERDRGVRGLVAALDADDPAAALARWSLGRPRACRGDLDAAVRAVWAEEPVADALLELAQRATIGADPATCDRFDDALRAMPEPGQGHGAEHAACAYYVTHETPPYAPCAACCAAIRAAFPCPTYAQLEAVAAALLALRAPALPES